MIIIGLIIFFAVFMVICMDIYLAETEGFSGTLSWWIYTNSVKYPIIPAVICLIVGLLIGHFFWNQELIVNTSCPKT